MTYWGIKKWNTLMYGRCSDKVRILSALAGLSLRQTKILWLSFCQPAKLQSWQIAKKLSISERTLRNEKRAALIELQRLCERNGVEDVKGDYFFDLGKRAGLEEYMPSWKPI